MGVAKRGMHGGQIKLRMQHKGKRACKKMLQRNLPEEVKVRTKSEYKEWKKVRELIEESKRRVDEEFAENLSKNFTENKKLFRKEVKRVRKGGRGGGVRMRGEDGELVRDGRS